MGVLVQLIIFSILIFMTDAFGSSPAMEILHNAAEKIHAGGTLNATEQSIWSSSQQKILSIVLNRTHPTYMFYRLFSNGSKLQAACVNAAVLTDSFIMCVQMPTLLDNVSAQTQAEALVGWETITPKAPITRTEEEEMQITERREKYTVLFEGCLNSTVTNTASTDQCVNNVIAESTAQRTSDLVLAQSIAESSNETIEGTAAPELQIQSVTTTNAPVSIRIASSELTEEDFQGNEEFLSVVSRLITSGQISYDVLFENNCSAPLDNQTLCVQFCCQTGMDLTTNCNGFIPCYSEV